MKRLLKWMGDTFGTVAVLALGAVAFVSVQSERLRSQTFEVPAGALAIGDSDVGLMSEMARSRFSSLTERESAALYAYLSETGGLDLVTPSAD